ncbi:MULTISPECIES: YpmA family protein [Bacillaceae]|uniref:YpmA family protein n=1 Tax=Evansella alkalicola TaxID=745819 RepID=A0ABS6K2B6_9BACI|nr:MULTISPECIES: YpmA family protein [Bacillaceae]MBU9723912.1 YpmA family protein [Bacillus alkalicola]
MERDEDKKGISKLHSIKVEKCHDLYKVVDGLNRTLKDRDLMFGLALDEKDHEKMIVTIYET